MIVYADRQIDNESQCPTLTSGSDDFDSEKEDSSATQAIPESLGRCTEVIESLQQPHTPPTAKSEHICLKASASATSGSVQTDDDGCPSVIDDDSSQDEDRGGSLATILRTAYKDDPEFAEKLVASVQQLPVRERRFLEAPGDFIPGSTSPIDDSVTETDEFSDAEASESVCHGTPHTDGHSRRHCNDSEETPTSSQSANCGKGASSAGPGKPGNTDGTYRNKRQKQSRKGKEKADNSEDEDEDDGPSPETSKNRKKPADDLPWSCPYTWNISGSKKDTMSSTCYPKYKKRTRCKWKNHLEFVHTDRGKGGSPEYIMKPEQWSDILTAIDQADDKRPQLPKLRLDLAERLWKKVYTILFPNSDPPDHPFEVYVSIEAIGATITSHAMKVIDKIVSVNALESVNENPHPTGEASAAELLPPPASSIWAMFEKAITISTQTALRDSLPYLAETAHTGETSASTDTSARAEGDLQPGPKMLEDKFTVSGETTKVILMLKRLADGPGQEPSHDVRIVYSPLPHYPCPDK
ncbi:Cation transport regulator-like protein 2 [Verticillium dahliae VDG2]|nr:Cation transport regulator-like protein 2 [Verticillium dahliae VDG2]